ncbi:hypothetical protein NBM05_08205 [Rothia sp. AR01]|uniref:Uncharacterized protein n=1 Tax=Rothia santali TaxID=2949643 RepID=A0A9X2HHV2_9MICC|nr:hypothetical protein [Rothia santali]MCP3425986.1 hypothetical protein [Rothia santali]
MSEEPAGASGPAGTSDPAGASDAAATPVDDAEALRRFRESAGPGFRVAREPADFEEAARLLVAFNREYDDPAPAPTGSPGGWPR